MRNGCSGGWRWIGGHGKVASREAFYSVCEKINGFDFEKKKNCIGFSTEEKLAVERCEAGSKETS